MVTIKSYPASSGDAFLISFGKNKDVNIMIDMGYVSTYTKHIKSDLMQLNKEGKKLDLLIISHIDSDHIRGALAFIKANKEKAEIIPIKDVWHNSYKHLQFSQNGDLTTHERQVLKNLINQNKAEYGENGVSDISAKEGSSFASYLHEYGYPWNKAFDNNAVVNSLDAKIISDLKITVISPCINKLQILADYWKDKLAEFIYNFKMTEDALFDDAFELYMERINESEPISHDCASEEPSTYILKDIIELANSPEIKDSSPTNGSSIACIVEYDKYKILFLGDAHEDVVYNNLYNLSLGSDHKLYFDLVKIAHHGSVFNISNRLMSIIESPKFLISTNGRNKEHPSHETISKIINKQSGLKKTIILNHPIPHLSPFNNEDLKKELNFEIIIQTEIELK